MPRIFITGSADGLGQMAAKKLIELGHQVVLHARNEERARQAAANATGAEDVLVADLSSMEETRALAEKANTTGAFDAVIHNAGVYRIPKNSVSADGLPLLFAVNTLAPYLLTCLMHKPQRLIYLSSSMHLQGSAHLDNLSRSTGDSLTYSDTKLHDLLLAKAVARKWTDVLANAVDPGWVPTKMGGAGAPDDLDKGYETQVWLAVSDEAEAKVSGKYFYHKRQGRYQKATDDAAMQEKLLAFCGEVSGVRFGVE